jgi:hypothetical protein
MCLDAGWADCIPWFILLISLKKFPKSLRHRIPSCAGPESNTSEASAGKRAPRGSLKFCAQSIYARIFSVVSFVLGRIVEKESLADQLTISPIARWPASPASYLQGRKCSSPNKYCVEAIMATAMDVDKAASTAKQTFELPWVGGLHKARRRKAQPGVQFIKPHLACYRWRSTGPHASRILWETQRQCPASKS